MQVNARKIFESTLANGAADEDVRTPVENTTIFSVAPAAAFPEHPAMVRFEILRQWVSFLHFTISAFQHSS